MSQKTTLEQAINGLLTGVTIAQQRGAFSLQEAATLFQAHIIVQNFQQTLAKQPPPPVPPPPVPPPTVPGPGLSTHGPGLSTHDPGLSTHGPEQPPVEQAGTGSN